MCDICSNSGVGCAIHDNTSVIRVANGVAADRCPLDISRVQELNWKTISEALLSHVCQLQTLNNLSDVSVEDLQVTTSACRYVTEFPLLGRVGGVAPCLLLSVSRLTHFPIIFHVT